MSFSVNDTQSYAAMQIYAQNQRVGKSTGVNELKTGQNVDQNNSNINFGGLINGAKEAGTDVLGGMKEVGAGLIGGIKEVATRIKTGIATSLQSREALDPTMLASKKEMTERGLGATMDGTGRDLYTFA